jgi:DNA-binding FadR family transcriptional regulator
MRADGLPASSNSGLLYDRVLDALGTTIVAGGHAAGDVLLLDELVVSYSASRPVIREVVRVLESMRLVHARRRVGVVVLERHQWNLFDPRVIRWRLACGDRVAQLRSLTDLRGGVEPLAAYLAATAASPDHCARLVAAVMGMSATGRAGDLQAYLQHDIDFHRTLLEASGNEMFASLADVVEAVLTGRTVHHLMPSEPKTEAIALHRQVADCIHAGDGEGARQAMMAILEEAATAILETSSARVGRSLPA